MHSSCGFMHAFSFDLRPSRRASSLTAGEMKDNLVEEIKEIYKRVNPDKKDVPELLAYYEGQELDLYKKICAKYNLEPKDRFGSILSRRRRRHRSGSSQEKGPSMPSRPGPADLRRNAAEADGLSGAEPKAVAADVADVSADAAETAVPMPPEPVPPEPEVPKGSARPQSPPLPPRNPGSSNPPNWKVLAMSPSAPQVRASNSEGGTKSASCQQNCSTTSQANDRSPGMVATCPTTSEGKKCTWDDTTASPSSQEGDAKRATGQNHSCIPCMSCIKVMHK